MGALTALTAVLAGCGGSHRSAPGSGPRQPTLATGASKQAASHVQPGPSAYAIALHALLLAPVIVAGFAILWFSQLSLSDMLGIRAGKVVVAPPAIE